MKSVLYRILIVQALLLSCVNGFSQSHKPDSVKVEFQGFDTETPFDISCDMFDYSFLKTKKTKVIHQKRELLEFESLKTTFEPAKDRAFDVRGKIIYYYGATNVKYCFDEYGYFSNDGKLYHNKKLIITIGDIMCPKHPEYLDTIKYDE